jgi:methionyl-tRNA formyltransferase
LAGHSRSLRLAFAGTPAFAVAALDALHAAGFLVAGVFTQADRPAGRGLGLQPSAVKKRALALGIPVLQPLTFKAADAAAALAGLDVDAFIVVAYGLILPAAVLGIPRLGSFNIHASLLPRWRGAAPIQRAILAGDAVTGVTIMRMEAGLDTGPMLGVRAEPILAEDTALSLHDRLSVLGGELLVSVLADLSAGPVPERAQPASGVTYAAKIDKAEARIDWREDAASLARKIRAFYPSPIAETSFRGLQLRIHEAQPSEPAAPVTGDGVAPAAAQAAALVQCPSPPPPGTVLGLVADGIAVACGQGVLYVKRLQLPGRKTVAAREFANAQPLSGARFGNE